MSNYSLILHIMNIKIKLNYSKWDVTINLYPNWELVGVAKLKCIKQIKQEHFHDIDGKKVKVARAEKGWTITKLSNESGVTRKTIGEIEKGYKKKIRYSTMEQIAFSWEKQVEYFCTRIEKKGEELDEF